MARRDLQSFLAETEEPAPAGPAELAVVPEPKLQDQARTAMSVAAQRLAAVDEPRPVARRRPRQVPAAAAGWGRQAVLDAHKSAKTTPKGWTAYTLNLPASVMNRLIAFIPDDQDATGLRSLAACHYIQAALSRLPAELEKAGALGQAWQAEHLLDRGGMAGGTGTRVQLDTETAAKRLGSRLRTLPYKVHLWEVTAALVTALLDDLGAP